MNIDVNDAMTILHALDVLEGESGQCDYELGERLALFVGDTNLAKIYNIKFYEAMSGSVGDDLTKYAQHLDEQFDPRLN